MENEGDKVKDEQEKRFKEISEGMSGNELTKEESPWDKQKREMETLLKQVQEERQRLDFLKAQDKVEGRGLMSPPVVVETPQEKARKQGQDLAKRFMGV